MPCASLGFVIARSDSDEAIQTLAQAALDCFACARNDEQATSFSRPLRARALPTTTHKKIRFLQQKGGEAPKGACANHVRAAPTDVAICQRLERGCAPLLEARPPSGASAAALATGYYPDGSASPYPAIFGNSIKGFDTSGGSGLTLAFAIRSIASRASCIWSTASV